jgi:hypothetical protein
MESNSWAAGAHNNNFFSSWTPPLSSASSLLLLLFFFFQFFLQQSSIPPLLPFHHHGNIREGRKVYTVSRKMETGGVNPTHSTLQAHDAFSFRFSLNRV